jgi:uncharacterized repeat protein (TIGR03837 family)
MKILRIILPSFVRTHEFTRMKTWDIFCRIIDNFGDIGVCWRLARQLAVEHQQSVRLWVDDLASLQRIWPTAEIIEHQQLAGVEVCLWPLVFDESTQPADIVIEAFACDIPDSYLTSMATLKAAGRAPTWINLEYLSAEAWVEECHGMTSAHPATGLRKTFFFPGFSPRTGGLLREQDLIPQRDAFLRHDPRNQNQIKQEWLQKMEVHPAANSLLISLFAYENSAVGELIDAWKQSLQPIHCLVPDGKILESINNALGRTLVCGNVYQCGNLTVQIIPFVTQNEYDRLLWVCDINFVRGEDSFVRAQWAGKPVVWHIYIQDEAAHLVKLQAFLAVYTPSNPALKSALTQFWVDWNEGGHTDSSWNKLMNLLPEWREHCENWSQTLSQAPDLAQQLYDYCMVS